MLKGYGILCTHMAKEGKFILWSDAVYGDDAPYIVTLNGRLIGHTRLGLIEYIEEYRRKSKWSK